MLPHYRNVISTLLALKIVQPNPRYDPANKDKDGVPLEPEVLWIESERYRVASFDEMKCDDKTHGDGNRKGRSERTIRCGPEDDGECIGTKHSSHPASVVGGTLGTNEALPCYAVTASATVDPTWFAVGPKTTINGKVIGMDGTCNAKGSVNNEVAIEYVKKSVLPAFAAYELPTAERKAVLICDGVGSHLSPEFCQFLLDNHIVLILRTPNCSNKQQPEDLVSFLRVKNGAGNLGFYHRKQTAVLRQLAETRSAGLPYDILFGECLKAAWENGFSTENNREAWRQAGLDEKGGITARPYWLQLRKEQPQQRRKCASDGARKRAISELSLERHAQWEALKAPWVGGGGAPSGALALTLAEEEAPEEEGEMTSGRLTSGELSQLDCAATDIPAQKFMAFKGDIAQIKKAKEPELRAALACLVPPLPYTKAVEAKVLLLRHYENLYASTPTLCYDKREVTIEWKVRSSWLPKDLKAVMYPQLENKEGGAKAATQQKKPRLLGQGAYLCCTPPPALPAPAVAVEVVEVREVEPTYMLPLATPTVMGTVSA